MRKVVLASIAAALLLASCVRSEDWEALRSPIHVSGQIDPQFGFPVATSQLYLEDIIKLIPQAEQYIDNSQGDGFINLKFDTVLNNNFNFANMKSRKNGRRAKGITQHGDTLVYDTVFVGSQEINFFDDKDVLQQIKLSKVIMNWDAQLSLNVTDEFQNIDTNEVKAYVSDFKIKATGNDGSQVEIPLDNVGTINIARLLSDHSYPVNILDNFDIATLATQLTQMAPRKLEYSGRFTLKVLQSFLTTPKEILYDSLKINSIDIRSDIDARFPLNLSIGYLAHTIDTVAFSMGDKLDSLVDALKDKGVALDMKNAQVKLKVENTLPFDAKLGAVVLDASQQTLLTILDTASDNLLVGAPIVPSTSDPTLYVTSGSAQSALSANISYDQLKQLQNGKYVKFVVALSTSRDNTGVERFVAPRQTDGISIKMYIKLHPGIELDLPLSFSQNNE